MTTVINIHDAPAGWQDDPRYVYIGRANKHYGLPKSVWANPYRIGTDGNRDEVIQRYRDYLRLNPKLQSLLPTLANKTLVCYCSPEACHGDVIVKSMSVTAPTPKKKYVLERTYWEPVTDHHVIIAQRVDDYGIVNGLRHTSIGRYTDTMLRRRYLRVGDVPDWWLGWNSTKAWLESIELAIDNMVISDYTVGIVK